MDDHGQGYVSNLEGGSTLNGICDNAGAVGPGLTTEVDIRAGAGDEGTVAVRCSKTTSAGSHPGIKDKAGSSPTPARPNTKKRRKVPHACVYCRRSHMTCDVARPCSRCVYREIGHLCRDEPREAEINRRKVAHPSVSFNESVLADPSPAVPHNLMGSMDQGPLGPPITSNASSGVVNGDPANRTSDMNFTVSRSHDWMPVPMNDLTYNARFMPLGMPNESDLLAGFLQSNPMDDGSQLSQLLTADPALLYDFSNSLYSGVPFGTLPAGVPNATGGDLNKMLPASTSVTSVSGLIPPTTPGSGVNGDKAKASDYYLMAADPRSGTSPEERIAQIMQAKFEAGLLKPFNYTNGYSRLLAYLDGHVAPSSKKKVLLQLNRFRPKFREKMQQLADIDLVYIEAAFEGMLSQCDRVFASMAVPACCWRRTGEIFRGNTEMAELLGVHVDRLRDGKISLHQILTEDSVVRYWEEFGTIAFDPDHESLLTACVLKHPDDEVIKVTNCCLSFMIRRDRYTL